MQFFDTDVQLLKNRVLTEVARLADEDALTPQHIMDIPEKLIPDGSEPTMRCCIYKERAILQQRVKLALGGNPDDNNIVEVLPIACDECPVEGIQVTQACRGCLRIDAKMPARVMQSPSSIVMLRLTRTSVWNVVNACRHAPILPSYVGRVRASMPVR